MASRTCGYALVLTAFAATALGGDWPMGGRSPSRNPVSPEKNPPFEWSFGDDRTPAKNVRWAARVGSRAPGGPVVANGLVWVGTNNRLTA